MKRRLCLAWALAAPWARADPSDRERARIERLLDAVAKRQDIQFIRNGKDYSAAQAADFLRGKFNWNAEKVRTVQDFIEQIGTRSNLSGDPYRVRLADGRVLTSAEFLRQELRRIEKR
jgi:Family of unknown function (DUF5329)